MLRTLKIRHYGPVCDVSETGLYFQTEKGCGDHLHQFLTLQCRVRIENHLSCRCMYFKQAGYLKIYMDTNSPSIFSDTKLYPPLHFHGFQAKQKSSYVQFSRRLISKTTAATPPGESTLLKFCQNVYNG